MYIIPTLRKSTIRQGRMTFRIPSTGIKFLLIMTTERINTNQARKEFADNINRVAYGHERLTVTRHGKPVAAIISVDDLEFLERLEHELNKKSIQEAWEEQGDKPLKSHDEVKSLLGLQ